MSLYNQSTSAIEISSDEEGNLIVALEDTSTVSKTVVSNCSKSEPGSFMEEKLNTLIDSYSKCTGPPLNGNIVYRMQPSNVALFKRCMQTAFTTSKLDTDSVERFDNAVLKLQKEVQYLAKNSSDWPRLVELLNMPFTFNKSGKLSSTLTVTAVEAWNNQGVELNEEYGNTSTMEGSSNNKPSVEISSKGISQSDVYMCTDETIPGVVVVASAKKGNEPSVAEKVGINTKSKILIKTSCCSRCFLSSRELHQTRKTVRLLKNACRALKLPLIGRLEQTVKSKSIEIQELTNKLKKSLAEEKNKNELAVVSARKNVRHFKKLHSKLKCSMQTFGEDSKKTMLELENKKKENETEIENLKAEIAKIVAENRVIEKETDTYIDKLHSALNS
ncbi:uncharacterized protein LOC131953305 [Physella acuta]|uniref:uncharacterized protein LOC131953305 n=1 Tax=Physella acuta TaxID=109671 RepID=UPI0027DACF96|nr:uncharacterized protein LOC131953305 [Physella acuta]XP_059172426.1 uncharacterized protein LOC131953305 [Physella acuta]